MGGTPEALGQTVDAELVKWAKLAKDASIKADDDTERHGQPTTLASRRTACAAAGARPCRARAAQRIADGYDQARVDELVTAAGWAIIEPARNRELAELAVADTGIGNVDDKIRKNHRKTLRPAA